MHEVGPAMHEVGPAQLYELTEKGLVYSLHICLNIIFKGQKRRFKEEELCHEQIDIIFTLKETLTSYMVYLGHEKRVLIDDISVIFE